MSDQPTLDFAPESTPARADLSPEKRAELEAALAEHLRRQPPESAYWRRRWRWRMRLIALKRELKEQTT